MKSPKSGTIGGQELLSFDGTLYVGSRDYNQADAKEAALHRAGRRGELALSPRTRGFRGRTNGLWVPHSGTENSAVVKMPTLFLQEAQYNAKDRVLKKYEDSDFSDSQVLLWALFAKNAAGRETIRRFERFQVDSRENHRKMYTGLGPEGEIERDRFESSAIAMQGLYKYLMSLRSFVGAEDVLGKGEKRKWPSEHHHKQYARRRDQARTFLDAIPDWDFNLTVKEAYWAERSRYEFWTRFEVMRRAMGRAAQQRLNAEVIQIPIEIYDQDPRANPANYVDGEFVN